jgi:hypothetical protein
MTEQIPTNNNICLSLQENEQNIKNTNITDLMNNFYLNSNNNYIKKSRTNSFDDVSTNYEDLSTKELNLICEYYNLSVNKSKKRQIINAINNFECFPENEYLVKHRKRLWFYMKTLKNDKILKKYTLW